MSNNIVHDVKIYAPKINPRTLWEMTSEDFITWRRENDYPRIINFLRKKLPDFEEWMITQSVSQDLLLKYFPSSFLREEPDLCLYTLIEKDMTEIERLVPYKYYLKKKSVGEKIKSYRSIIPYPTWFRDVKKKEPLQLRVNYRSGGSHFLLSELELLNLGNYQLTNKFFTGRQLDFVNINGLVISNCVTNSTVKLWFSSAENLVVKGNFAFIDAYQTPFSEWYNGKSNNLNLYNGVFQSWRLENCSLNIFADNAILHLWNVKGEDFDATINSTDVRDCKFNSIPIKYPIQISRAINFHANLKRLYSQLGKKKEASNHYYLEKTFERKSFLHIRENHREAFYRHGTKIGKKVVKVIFLFKYIQSAFLNILWGYGERPARVFTISILSILLFAVFYCYLPNASPNTYHHFANALYYSMVTFTTLGYGDISQSDQILRLLSGFEALLGMSFWGILIAGFTNNAKDY